MKKKIFPILALIACLVVLFPLRIELFLLKNNFSWVLSKLTPYLLFAIAGILLSVALYQRFNNSTVKKVSCVLALFVPFAIGFSLNPIYEGDFSYTGTKLKNTPVKINKNVDLLVITIPNCPFCYQSIGMLNLMKKRNPKLKIRYEVCTSDSMLTMNYREIAKVFDINLASDMHQSAQFASGKFPSFFLCKNGKAIERFSNNQFGAGAKDKIENLKK
jgi:hypothetical protein